jgi:hypothetical protein
MNGHFIGTENEDLHELTCRTVKQCMADFTYITWGDRNAVNVIASSAWDYSDETLALNGWGRGHRIANPRDYMAEHRKFTQFFEDECEKYADKKVVLVTHHAMSKKSIMPRFENDQLMNGGYASHMEWFFEKHKNVAVHCHGHMHDFIRYESAATRVYCNPFGYYRHEPKDQYGPLQIEV